MDVSFPGLRAELTPILQADGRSILHLLMRTIINLGSIWMSVLETHSSALVPLSQTSTRASPGRISGLCFTQTDRGWQPQIGLAGASCADGILL